jgi:hypothetical protein
VLDGGELVVLAQTNGHLTGIARQRMQAGLLGRDRAGSALLLRYRDADGTGLDLVRANIQ